MKTTKRTFTMTALSLLLCFCMVFGLTACGGFTQDDIDKAVNDATTPLNEQITAIEADIAEKTAKITTLESEKAALVTEKGELEADITSLEAEKGELEADITSLEAEKAALEDDKAELEDEVETLEAEKKALTDENTELEASITSKNAEIATLTSSVSSLEAEKTTLNGRVSELNAQITTLNERIADLEAGGETDGAEITELKAKVSTLEGEKTTLSARVTELEGTIEDKNAEITDLEDDVATLTTDKAALEGQITSLNGTITAKNNDIANLNSSISALETEKANLEEQVTTLNASISAKETEIANLNSSIATLTAEKQALTDRVTALENAALKNCVKGNHVAGTYSKTETTHTYTCTVCGTEITEEHEYVEGTCVCGAEIYDISATTLTAEELKNVVAETLNTGITEMQITLAANASAEMFTAIREALVEADIPDGSVDLTLAGVTAVPNNSESSPLFGMFEDPGLPSDTRCEAVAELRSISLPDAVTIGDYAFQYCENLTSLYAPKVQIVHEGAFTMTGLVTVELPEAMTLEYKAFMECKALTSIKLPKVTTVGGLALDVVDPDTEVTIYLTADSDITIDEKCFWWVDNELLDEEVNLVLHTSKQSQVSGNTWTTKTPDGEDVSFTFKSISFVS